MSKISRRTFLSDTFLAAAAMSAFGTVSMPKKARAQGRPLGPNETLGVMVVGCGGRGMGSHIPEFLEDSRTNILYVCDPDPAHAAQAADLIEQKTQVRPKIVADMREALDDKNLDVVSCAAANHWHALTGVWAMQAGKDVYLEKPICHNVHEGQALIAAAKKYGRCCQVGSQCRSNPAVKDAFRYAAEGKLGEIKLTRGLCYKRRKSIGPLGAYPVPEGIDYNLWSGPAPVVDPVTRPNFHYDWHWQRLYGNGDLGNQGPHQTDIARTFLGVTEFPCSVISYGGRLGYQAERRDDSYVDAGDTANTEVSIYNYRDGRTLVFETRGLETDPLKEVGVGVIAYGSEGYMVQTSYGFVIVFDRDGLEVTRFGGGDDTYHFSNFLDCVVDGTPEKLNADARAGHLSAGLSHLGNISYYLGEKNYVSPEEAERIVSAVPGNDDNAATLRRTLDHLTNNGVDLEKTPLSMGVALEFDPDKEVFVGNSEANAMLTREYRGEFVVPNPEDV